MINLRGIQAADKQITWPITSTYSTFDISNIRQLAERLPPGIYNFKLDRFTIPSPGRQIFCSQFPISLERCSITFTQLNQYIVS
nr:MAG TPA: hypothetical protein [Caudoviricetes sp.]